MGGELPRRAGNSSWGAGNSQEGAGNSEKRELQKSWRGFLENGDCHTLFPSKSNGQQGQ